VLYAVGGDNHGHLNTVEAYDPATNTWTTKAATPTARTALAAGVLGGRLYALGGYERRIILNKTRAYTPATNTWIGKPSMPTARYSLAAVAVGRILYAIGGCCDSSGSPLNTNEAFNPR
jgi:N-acetylneuraminic acid mutarotase